MVNIARLAGWHSVSSKRSDAPSPRMMRLIEDLVGDWRRLDECIEPTLMERDPTCERLMTVPGARTTVRSSQSA
jgi:hypothetical protein